VKDSTVWGDNPVEVDTCTTCSRKMGVYWEKKWPTAEFDTVKIGKKKYQIIKMKNLENGIVRLVGRFWSADSTYKVKFKAKVNNSIYSMLVTIKRPNKLGSKKISKDVFDKSISIDSICITNGGKYGILPQFIKGHIANESIGFLPSYRYEPYSTEFDFRDANNNFTIKEKWKNHPFIVDSFKMGDGSSIPNHLNVKYYDYLKSPTKVWDIIKKYSTIEENIAPGGVIIYGRKESNDSLNFERYGYSTVQNIYNKILSHFQGKKNKADSSVFKEARDSTITYLRKSWNGGLENLIAQTRLASSYGLLQLLHSTAIIEGYPDSSSKAPEDLNINSINLPLSMKRLLKFLKNNGLLGDSLKIDNWPYGYEATFQRMLIGWNSRVKYSNEVLENSKSYLPKN
jgi:hypothetical protein